MRFWASRRGGAPGVPYWKVMRFAPLRRRRRIRADHGGGVIRASLPHRRSRHRAWRRLGRSCSANHAFPAHRRIVVRRANAISRLKVLDGHPGGAQFMTRTLTVSRVELFTGGKIMQPSLKLICAVAGTVGASIATFEATMAMPAVPLAQTAAPPPTQSVSHWCGTNVGGEPYQEYPPFDRHRCRNRPTEPRGGPLKQYTPPGGRRPLQ